MYCNQCNKEQDETEFYRVIKRHDYGLYCDEHGDTYFKKLCKMCRSCRSRLQRNINNCRDYKQHEQECEDYKVCSSCNSRQEKIEFKSTKTNKYFKNCLDCRKQQTIYRNRYLEKKYF